MKLISTNLTIVKKTGNGLIKAFKAAGNEADGFAIKRDNGDYVVDAAIIGTGQHTVTIGNSQRIIPRSAVVQTARLYVDAQRLRNKLNTADCMVIRPV